MTDEPTPGQQEENPGQQVPPSPGSTDPVVDYEARYKGSVKKIETLTLSNRELQAQLEGMTSEIEQLKSQLGVKDVERDVAVTERDKQLKEIIENKTVLEKELKDLRALKLKIEVAREINRPELIKIADRIPAVDDKEVLLEIMKDFASFADDAAKQREEQLLAGVTPPSGSGMGGQSTPASTDGWLNHINSLVLGSPERKKALDDYGDWLEQQRK